jgi:hypothetical protein
LRALEGSKKNPHNTHPLKGMSVRVLLPEGWFRLPRSPQLPALQPCHAHAEPRGNKRRSNTRLERRRRKPVAIHRTTATVIRATSQNSAIEIAAMAGAAFQAKDQRYLKLSYALSLQSVSFRRSSAVYGSHSRRTAAGNNKLLRLRCLVCCPCHHQQRGCGGE